MTQAGGAGLQRQANQDAERVVTSQITLGVWRRLDNRNGG